MWKKSAEISRKILFGHQKPLRTARGGSAIAFALLLWISPPYGALTGSILYVLLTAALALLSGKRHYLAIAVLLAAFVVFLLFPRSDQLGAIGIGLFLVLLGIEAWPPARKEQTLIAVLEMLFPILLGVTFIVSCRGSFTLSAPFYGLALFITGIQKFRY